MTTTPITDVSIAARRLLAYFDADEAKPGPKLTDNRVNLAAHVDALRLAVAAEDIEVGR